MMPVGYREPKLVTVPMTIDRIDAMLRALDMPVCSVFARPNLFGVSVAAQGCGALERKLRLPGIEVEHLRYHTFDGFRMRMLLGYRVLALEGHLGVLGWLGTPERGLIAILGGENEKMLAEAGITVKHFKEGQAA